MGFCCGEKEKVPVGVKKLKSIFKGFSNYVWPSKEMELIAKERAVICSECEDNTSNFCKDCKCWIPAKIRSPDETCKKWQ